MAGFLASAASMKTHQLGEKMDDQLAAKLQKAAPQRFAPPPSAHRKITVPGTEGARREEFLSRANNGIVCTNFKASDSIEKAVAKLYLREGMISWDGAAQWSLYEHVDSVKFDKTHCVVTFVTDFEIDFEMEKEGDVITFARLLHDESNKQWH